MLTDLVKRHSSGSISICLLLIVCCCFSFSVSGQGNPGITSFTPAEATSGTSITITGYNLTGTTAVSIGGVAVSSFQVLSSSSVTAVVPLGAVSGTIDLTTPGGNANKTGFTFFSAPTITYFYPAEGRQGDLINIYGPGVTYQVQSVTIGGVPAASFSIQNSYIRAQVGAGASGEVQVTTSLGTTIKGGFIFRTQQTNYMPFAVAARQYNQGRVTWTQLPYLNDEHSSNVGAYKPDLYTDANSKKLLLNILSYTAGKSTGKIVVTGISSSHASSIAFKNLVEQYGWVVDFQTDARQINTVSLLEPYDIVVIGGRQENVIEGGSINDPSFNSSLQTYVSNGKGVLLSGDVSLHASFNLNFKNTLLLISPFSYFYGTNVWGAQGFNHILKAPSHPILQDVPFISFPYGAYQQYYDLQLAPNSIIISDFVHYQPVITSVRPFCAGTGDTLTISGYGFPTVLGVYGLGEGSSYNVVSPTTIKAVVGTGSVNSSAMVSVQTIGPSSGILRWASAPFSYTAKPSITASGPTNICEGQTVVLTAPTGWGYTYLWNTGATTRAITVNTPGNYSVTVKNTYNCTNTSAPVSVTVNSQPLIPAIHASGPLTFCQGGSVILSAPVGYSYLWSNGATTRSISITSSGSYQVTVTGEGGCSSTSASTKVAVTQPPVPAVSMSGPLSFCPGDSVILTAPEGYTYLWSNGATQRSLVVKASGTYQVTVTTESRCSATSASISVIVNTIPSSTVTASGPPTFCNGGYVTLTAAPNTSYLWSNGETTQSINASITDDYTVRVTNTSGCSLVSDTIKVKSLLAGVNGPYLVCERDTVQIWASSGFTTYQWKKDGVNIQDTGTEMYLRITEGGNYTVTGSTPGGSCTSPILQVTKVKAPVLDSLAGNVIKVNDTQYKSCGPAALNIRVTYFAEAHPDTAIRYELAYDDGTSGVGQGDTLNLAKSAQVKLFLRSVACSSEVNFHVNVQDVPPIPKIRSGGPLAFCQGESVVLTAPEGYTHLWTNGATTRSITVSAAGEYGVKVTNENGCSSNSGLLTVIVNSTASNE